MEKELHDISQVCGMLGTTSRTLRFYEEKGLIQSTTVGISARRQYTNEQIAHIKNVLVLRALGLSVRSIRSLLSGNKDLKEEILSRRAEVYAAIDAHYRELRHLNEALLMLETGKDVFFDTAPSGDASCKDAEEMALAFFCADAVACDDTERLYSHFSRRMLCYMPREVYAVIREEVLLPLGKFISVEKAESDPQYPSRIFCYLQYENRGLKITFVFHDREIVGLWFNYYDIKAGGASL